MNRRYFLKSVPLGALTVTAGAFIASAVAGYRHGVPTWQELSEDDRKKLVYLHAEAWNNTARYLVNIKYCV